MTYPAQVRPPGPGAVERFIEPTTVPGRDEERSQAGAGGRGNASKNRQQAGAERATIGVPIRDPR